MKGVSALAAFSTRESRVERGRGEGGSEKESGRGAVSNEEKRWEQNVVYGSSLNSNGHGGRGKIHFQVGTDVPGGPPTVTFSRSFVFYATHHRLS